ncbi:hypothetical protein EHS25_003063 [Saitozyma podzolica]|uniref:Uncharacterized protein n=1 Tax=Saitozyma podzolica TaxID=1890683 RepID=A0A427YCG9_9TREE|nr:hypothetical protein EHS25_003063 [Saitozyma podzolica]
MPILATVGNHFSQLLHDFVFSFPSPGNITVGPFKFQRSGDWADIEDGGAGEGAGDGAFENLVNEPGETRALAHGVGALSFAGSGYGICLVLTAILLNRIHHIVRRPNPPIPPLPHPPVNSWYWRMRRGLANVLTSPETPRFLRLPGLICLFRAWLLFTILLLQVSNLWPVDPDSAFFNGNRLGRVVVSFGEWAGGMEMQKACWQVFLSVCCGLVCSGLANGLDRGRRRDVGAGFNLFGYSFLLHLYSSPLTHHRLPQVSSHGRPDFHALFQLWLSLTELTWLQALELSTTMRRNQLLPTAVCGGLGLAHFVYALTTAPLRFPSFTFLTHLLALFLSIVVTFSILVKAITHIFTLGYIPTPLSSSLLPHEGSVPSIEDDFGVALLKLGTACLEATQYSGLRNELVGVEERHGPWVEIGANGSSVKQLQFGSAGGFGNEITQVDVSEPEDPGMESPYWREMRTFWQTFAQSVVLHAHNLVLSTPGGKRALEFSRDMWQRRWWYGPRRWNFWRREAWAEPPRFRQQAILRRIQAINERAAALRAEAERHGEDTATASSSAIESSGQSRSLTRRSRSRQTTPAPLQYADYLRGEIELEDDEEEWLDHEDDHDGSVDASSSGWVSDGDGDGDGDGDDADEDITPSMYRDLLSEQAQANPDLQPVLLAHLTSSSSSPLTRRGYRALLAPPGSQSAPFARDREVSRRAEEMHDIVLDQRAAMASRDKERERDEWDDDRRRNCVVCTIEPRDTILWPSRLAAKDHMCPCCRRKVDGFSRIYVP